MLGKGQVQREQPEWGATLDEMVAENFVGARCQSAAYTARIWEKMKNLTVPAPAYVFTETGRGKRDVASEGGLGPLLSASINNFCVSRGLR